MPNPDEIALKLRLDNLQKHEWDLRNEQWQKNRLNEQGAKCAQNPANCGIGAYRAERTWGSGWNEHQNHPIVAKARAEGRPMTESERKSLAKVSVGLERYNRELRLGQISKELADVKVQRTDMIETYNAEQMAKINKQFAQQQAVFKQKVLKAKHRGGHPELGTTRSPSRRTSRGTIKRRSPIMRKRQR